MSEPKNVRSDARPNWKLCYERFPVALVGFPPNTVHCQLRNGAEILKEKHFVTFQNGSGPRTATEFWVVAIF